MDKEILEVNSLTGFIGKSYSHIGDDVIYCIFILKLLNSRKNIIKKIINNRALPEEGLDDITIEMFLNTLASMDSNNGINHIGIGEREGRIYSYLVKKRNFGLIHGMGRSGNVTELQPKAVGSSLIVQLTISLVLNLLHDIGMAFVKNLIILPFATGMSITLSFLTLKAKKPNAKYVIWSRIDQKTCFKSMFTSNLIPVVVEPILSDNKQELITDLVKIEEEVQKLGAENILCVFSTTSCFAPRGYDKIQEIAVLCKKYDIPHLINNAYGITCTKIMDLLVQANKSGRVDVIISSTDKNFMVPVGGSLIYSSNDQFVDSVKKNYPGRASIAPIVDLFVTLLDMGKNKYKQLLKDRKERYKEMKEVMSKVALKHEESIIENPNNKISIAMSIVNICKESNCKKDTTYLGSLFYSRQISGIRILAASDEMDFNGYKFKNYGSHSNSYPILPYANFAAAIGITSKEIIDFASKFSEIVHIYKNSFKTSILKNPEKNINDISSSSSNQPTTTTISTDDKKNKEKKKNKNKNKQKNVQQLLVTLQETFSFENEKSDKKDDSGSK